MSEQGNQPVQYVTQSRGYKTKGAKYKDRYVQKDCPECGNPKAYKDEWKTRVKYSCMKRDCRHVWYERIEIKKEETQVEETTNEMTM